MVTPPTPTSGIIRLMHVPFDSNYKNVIDFKSDVDKDQYFLRHIVKLQGTQREIALTLENCQYTRKDGKLQVPIHIDLLNQVNYLMYNNPYYTNKWYYCFVISKRYINDHCTELFLKTDVYQTWISNASFRPSFVEREHTLFDYPGANLLPEGLETGEFVGYEKFDLPLDGFAPIPCIAFTGDKIGSIYLNHNGMVLNGILSCIPFIISMSMHDAKDLIKQINDEGQGDKIFACFTLPQLAVQSDYQNISLTTQKWIQVQHGAGVKEILTLPKPTKIDRYIPRNKKLLTYPYTYLGFNAPNGSSKIYRFENFLDDEICFSGISEINPNPTVVIFPHNYSQRYENIQEAVTLNGYPTLSYRNDYYNTWLAQNNGSIQVSIDRSRFNYDVAMKYNENAQNREMTNAMFNGIASTVGTISNALTLNVGGALNSAIGGLQSASNSGYNINDLKIGEYASRGNLQYDLRAIQANSEKQEMLPDTGALSSSNATLLGYDFLRNSCFKIYGIKTQQAERIDEYFDMFGYQTNRVKYPNLSGRKSWNYVKTVGVNILGNIPEDDRLEMCNIFDNGVTIWHYPAQIYNYGADNRIEV